MKALLSSTLVLIFTTSFATPAFATTPQTFKIDQTDFLLQTSAGKTLNENIVVQNLTDTKQSLLISFEGYTLPAKEVLDQSYLTKHTIDFAYLTTAQVELEAFTSSTVPIVLRPPSRYPSGDYYGSLILRNNDSTQKVNFTVRILGQLKEGIEIKEIANSGNFLVYKVINHGTIASSFSFKSVVNYFLVQNKLLDSGKETIRSGEIREIKINHGKFLPGYYQTQTTLKFGSKETNVTKLFSFWVNPEFFLISVITIVFSFVLYFVFKRRQA